MNGSIDFDVAVIGGGIVGLASAYKITLSHPDIRIAILEKEEQLACHQTGHNSGVIHSGLYYAPGSVKAKTCIEGRKQLVAFAKKHRIPHEICGKIIVATRPTELVNLEMILQNGLDSHIEGIEEIGPEQIREIEPCCEGIAGVRVPCTGIIDFRKVAEKLAELVVAKGNNKILVSHEVTALDKHDFYTRIVTSQEPLNARYIINCAGLQCDRIAKMDGVSPKMRIVPFRGDYYELTEEAREKIRSLIYPVPDPALPFLGVHFTRTIDGTVECGPSAVFSFKREGYGKYDFNWADTWNALSYRGLWRMFFRYWRYGLGEYARSLSKTLFVRQLRKLVPSLQGSDISPCKAGVRAQALKPNGDPIDDFRIERKGNSIHVLNAPSPAATASLAIGDYISQIASNYFNLPSSRKENTRIESVKGKKRKSTGTPKVKH
ncbi:MAG: hydroxyglutarate oxidase [Planctomycetes bacterium RBG_16_55_9]|nr:MAG: hydroxyglutarate oxidase [Planctomycetes bacterium RBG_16_55_9]